MSGMFRNTVGSVMSKRCHLAAAQNKQINWGFGPVSLAADILSRDDFCTVLSLSVGLQQGDLTNDQNDLPGGQGDLPGGVRCAVFIPVMATSTENSNNLCQSRLE